MKRKLVTAGVIFIGLLVLLFIGFVVAAPVWVRLGFEPVCIQGDGLDIKLVPCTNTARVTPLPLPSLGEQGPVPLIYDDDGSPDGLIALLFFLKNPNFDVQAVTISYGEAHPQVFAPKIAQLLGMLGRADIPVGAGSDTPLSGDNAFPDPWREASDGFWSIELRPVEQVSRLAAADELIIETANQSSQPVAVFISGSHTNLAQALRKDPSLAAKIRAVYVMGGSIYTPGNIESDWPEIHNQVAEWNIWVDPLAASEVFASGIPIHLVPLDATRQVIWRRADVPSWRAGGTPEGEIAAGLLQMMIENFGRDGMFVWDLVAAIHASQPATCPEVRLDLEVLTDPGPEQGQTVIAQERSPVFVCLKPNQGQVKALAAGVLTDK